MTKAEELADPNSCWNRAKDDQQVFVLVDHDPAFSGGIFLWAMLRIMYGCNEMTDAKVQTALAEARHVAKVKGKMSYI